MPCRITLFYVTLQLKLHYCVVHAHQLLLRSLVRRVYNASCLTQYLTQELFLFLLNGVEGCQGHYSSLIASFSIVCSLRLVGSFFARPFRQSVAPHSTVLPLITKRRSLFLSPHSFSSELFCAYISDCISVLLSLKD